MLIIVFLIYWCI